MTGSLDGLRFRAVAAGDGYVTPATLFLYHQVEDIVWAEYSGGAIRRGYLVGTRSEDTLESRYVQLGADGRTSSGRCRSAVERGPDGSLRLADFWSWESCPGSGTMLLEQVHEGAG